jgi:hypothetical protein
VVLCTGAGRNRATCVSTSTESYRLSNVCIQQGRHGGMKSGDGGVQSDNGDVDGDDGGGDAEGGG